MRTYISIGIVLGSLAVSGCVMAPQARVPEIPPNADESTRRGLYEQYKLTADIGLFSATWKRVDGEYSWPQLKQLSEQHPTSDDVYGRAQTRASVVGGFASAGGGLVGATFGWNLGASELDLSRNAQVALYATGGGLIVVSLIMAAAWHNPIEDFADTYNTALRQRLGLPALAPEATPSSSNWVPRPVAGGYGWRF